jgi:hypothetical protein
LIEFGLLVLEKKIFKNFQCIFTLSLLSPLGEELSPSFKVNSLQQRMICAKSCQNWPSGSGEVENVKVDRQTDKNHITSQSMGDSFYYILVVLSLSKRDGREFELRSCRPRHT